MPAQILVRGGYVLSIDPEIGDLPVGDVLITDGRISAIGADLEVEGAEVVDASGGIVLPGLVDGHRHLWQSLLRGAAVDWSLPEYMIEARSIYCGCFDPDAAYLSNYLGGLESLAAGITTVVDHSHLQKSPEISDALAQGLLDSRVGGFFCYALQNVPDFIDDPDVDTERLRDLLTRSPDGWHDANARRVQQAFFADPHQRLRFGVALPEAAPYLPPVALQPLLARAKALNPALLTGHWDASGPEPVLGALLDQGDWPEHTSLTHGNHLQDQDLDAMVLAGVGICTTPDIECGMGTGSLAARRFVARGGAASLGTDLSSYARADILQQARLLLQVERMTLAAAGDGLPSVTGWPAREVLELVTQQAANSIGLGSEIGSLTLGKRGDVVVVRPDTLGAAPQGDPIATLLFYTSPAEIETVIVEGQLVKREGALVHVDLDELRGRAADAASRVYSRYHKLPRLALEQVWAGMF